MNPQISEEIGFKFRTHEIPISPHKGVFSCFFNHSLYTTIYEIQSVTVKQQPHNVPVLNILMQYVSTPNNPKTYDSGPCFRGRALHDTLRDYVNIPRAMREVRYLWELRPERVWSSGVYF